MHVFDRVCVGSTELHQQLTDIGILYQHLKFTPVNLDLFSSQRIGPEKWMSEQPCWLTRLYCKYDFHTNAHSSVTEAEAVKTTTLSSDKDVSNPLISLLEVHLLSKSPWNSILPFLTHILYLGNSAENHNFFVTSKMWIKWHIISMKWWPWFALNLSICYFFLSVEPVWWKTFVQNISHNHLHHAYTVVYHWHCGHDKKKLPIYHTYSSSRSFQ